MTPERARSYRVAIIGAGRIAAGFDTPDSQHILTHAHAFSKNPRTELAGFFDVDAKKSAAEAKKWSTNSYASLEELLAAKPDIVVIASPDDTHASLLRTVAAQKVRLVVCEKPIATTEADTETLRNAIEIPVIVNFRRRFDPVAMEIAAELSEVISARGIYTTSLLHNGSHMLDLARLFFGEVISHQKLYDERGQEGGAAIGAYLSFERCQHFFLMTGDARAYDVFDLEIFCESKRIRFFDEGMRVVEQHVVTDPIFEEYKILGGSQRRETGLIDAMARLAEHTVDVLDGKAAPISDLQNAIKTQDACFSLLR